jgi:two-component system chemotaxis response regulator CheY
MKPSNLPIEDGDWEQIPLAGQNAILALLQRVEEQDKEVIRLQARLAETTSPSLQKPKCVLVVDDSPLVRKTVGELVKRSGHQIIEAENGKIALAEAREYHPDLIVLDVNMPVKGGMDTLKELRADSELQFTPVVMLTSESDRRTITEAASKQVSGYIIKDKWEDMSKKLAKFLEL